MPRFARNHTESCSLGVAIEPLGFGYLYGRLAQFSRGGLIQSDNIGDLQEVCDTQRRTETSTASGGQYVAGTSNIIAEDNS